MPTVGQIYYNVVDNNNGSYISSGQNIFNDIVSTMGGGNTRFTKLGVQAPPGTKVILNDNKEIMVGKTGIYELDDNIYITSMYFVRPRRYIKDVEASEKAKQDGIAGMLAADNKRKAAMQELNADFPTIPTDEFLEDGETPDPNYKEYWDRYNDIQTEYITEYQEALNLFNTGSNGIYVLPNPNNVNAPENFEDLYNVIIDFIYE